MADRRAAQGLTLSRRRGDDAEAADAGLDREIEAALAIEPSPEFVARVRTRIASEPAPASWWQLRWPVIATALAAAAVVMIVAFSWRPSAPEQVAARSGADVVLTEPAREPTAPQVSEPQTIESRAPRAVARSVRRTGSEPAVARTVPSSREPVGRTLSASAKASARPRRSSPLASEGGSGPADVLISRDEQRGLELLITAVRDGRFTPVLASQLARDATVEATDIAISDIVIQPLQQIAALEGEGQ
jgi:hypothetical protein